MPCRNERVGIAPNLSGHRAHSTQRGYALMLVTFFVAVVLISIGAASPNLFSEGRREKEEEMIWRGKQYERAIRLFYAKNRKLPASIEELTKPNPSVRFMRQAYKDPMNKSDGSWRLIYVGPAGELIGSTRPNTFFKLGVPGGIRSSAATSSENGATAANQNASASVNANGNGAQTAANFSESSPRTVTDTAQSPSVTDTSQQSQVFGGKIVGVGSKVDKRSIIWRDGAKNYLQFEFVWDPSKSGMGVNPAKLLTAPPTDPQPQGAGSRFPNALRNPTDPVSGPQP